MVTLATNTTEHIESAKDEAGDAMLRRLSAQVLKTLAEVLPARSKCALVDFPNYANVGDSAIWLGERAALKRLGVDIVYSCDRLTYSKAQLQGRIDDKSIILMQGGGNFGDVWHHHQLFREQVISEFPNNRIVILPQSICFEKAETQIQAKSVIDGHGGVTIMVRDWNSLDAAQAEFRSQSILCPDMAFALGTLEPVGHSTHDVVWLSRTDKESRQQPMPPVPESIYRADWGEDPPVLSKIRHLFTGQSEELRQWWQTFYGPKLTTYDWLARMRLFHGLRILSRGRRVVTDRLHGYILSVLLGKPTVVLDNSYGKVSSYYKTWASDDRTSVLAESPQQALDLARTTSLLGSGHR